MSATLNEIYTIGHSTQPLESFLALLKKHEVEVIADVRSVPESRWNPQYSQDILKPALRAAGIRYVFLGDELGARSSDPACYEGTRVVYGRIANTAAFHHGLERLIEGASRYRVAMMCAEKEPAACHRTILVSRRLCELGFSVRHILPHGDAEDHARTMDRLAHELKLDEPNLFRSYQDSLELAYAIQEEKIAYQKTTPEFGEADIR